MYLHNGRNDMRYNNTIPVDAAKHMLKYDPVTGELRWAVKRPGFAVLGGIAGHIDDNHRGHAYRKVTILGKVYKAHRVIWAMLHGCIPDGFDIDHINGDCLDNRQENLRAVDMKTNAQNVAKARSDSSSGVRGVFPVKDSHGTVTRYRVTIQVTGEGRKHIGYFRTLESAKSAYERARRSYHAGFARS